VFCFIFKDFYNLGLDKVINYQYKDLFVTDLRIDKLGLPAVKENGHLKPGGILKFMAPEAKIVFYKQYQDLIKKKTSSLSS
jgi:hypothetical protein